MYISGIVKSCKVTTLVIKWLGMTDSYKEQHPLLCDDYSEEEFDVKSYNYQSRSRPLHSGRARNYAKGAAAVITRWPDNCSTSVVYWWLGASMIAITFFVIYNSVLIFGMIPTSDIKQPKFRIFNNEIKPKVQMSSSSNVYMHLIIDNNTDAQVNRYLPYATVITKKYPSFKYKFLVLLNDTFKKYNDYKDEERNEIAFNSLWKNDKHNKKLNKYNISIEYLSLTEYLNYSPINKFWRHLPPQVIEFLVRSISIWEKGGIAFNPKILIPKLYHNRYIEKLHDLFNIYVNSSSNYAERKVKNKINGGVNKRRPNNIQDIINDLGKDEYNISNVDLSEAENNDVAVVSNIENILKYKRDLKHSPQTYIKSNLTEINSIQENDIILNKINHTISSTTNSTVVSENILPLFLKYLFHNKSQNVTPDLLLPDISRNNTPLFDSSISVNQNLPLPVENVLKPSKVHDERNGTIISSKKSDIRMPIHDPQFWKISKYDNIPELSIDIKGNIIASKAACHAFLGTIFSNVIQHTEDETITDFIMSELSLFCNGLLTSCRGINVILV